MSAHLNVCTGLCFPPFTDHRFYKSYNLMFFRWTSGRAERHTSEKHKTTGSSTSVIDRWAHPLTLSYAPLVGGAPLRYLCYSLKHVR